MNEKRKIRRINEIWKPLSELIGLLVTSASVIAFAYTLAPWIAQSVEVTGIRALPYFLVLPPFVASIGIPLYLTVRTLEYFDRRIQVLKDHLKRSEAS